MATLIILIEIIKKNEFPSGQDLATLAFGMFFDFVIVVFALGLLSIFS